MNEPPPSPSVAAAPMTRAIGVKQLVWIVAILGVTILLTTLTSDVTKASEPGIRMVNGQPYLPDKVGEWTGGEVGGLSEREKIVLPEDTGGIRRRYTDAQGHDLSCSVIVAGRDVTSIHRPELCLPSQGWKIQNEQVESVPLSAANGGSLKVMRMDSVHTVAQVAPGRPAQAMFIYWFVGKDRVTPHHWERILWSTTDRIFHNRNHRWAYLLITAPVRSEATESGIARAQGETMKVLGSFAEQLYPLLSPVPHN